MSLENPWFVVPVEWHNAVVRGVYLTRAFQEAEVEQCVRLCESAALHGIRTHNALKAVHLDDLFGSKVGGCVPGAEMVKLPSRFAASEVWDANRKLGPAVAYEAMARAVELAGKFGVGTVSVDNAFHYLWGGAYALAAAEQGYIGYTNCTSLLAGVVPYGGKIPALGTNPHTWAFPTQHSIGFPVLIDWATSAISMGRVQQLAREGKPLPLEAAIDAEGHVTADPALVAGLLPFGAYKGYGLGLINELFASVIGGYLPKLRGRPGTAKNSCCFFFMAIHPEAISSGDFFRAATLNDNMRNIIENILEGNEGARLPGAKAAQWRERSRAAGGLLFSVSEVRALNEFAGQAGVVQREFPPELMRTETLPEAS